jgi:hypothetical protein
MCTADREHEQHGVQPDEHRGPTCGASESPRGPRCQGDRSEARDEGEHLERPQPAGQTERCRRVAEQCEQRTVRRVLIRPAYEREDFVAGYLCGDVRVRV